MSKCNEWYVESLFSFSFIISWIWLRLPPSIYFVDAFVRYTDYWAFFMCCFLLLVLLFGVIFFLYEIRPLLFLRLLLSNIFCVFFLFNTKVLYAEDRFIESFLSNVILNVLFYFLHYMADTLSLNGGTSADHSERYLEPTRRRYFIPDKHGYDWACLRAFHI